MFKVGDKVRIRKDSKYYTDNGPRNPIGISGYISRFFGDGWINVEWDNGKYNNYREKDLEFDFSYLQKEEARVLLGLSKEGE